MATLPPAFQSATVDAIYAWWGSRLERPRPYLGGSVIGRECERQLWYSFRWVSTGGQFDGRMLRLFDRGHREEPVFCNELRGIGVKVHDVDPRTGEQFRFKAVFGHAGGGIDGAGLGIPEAPKTWHLLEFKTHGAKSFAELRKAGVAKAKPEHWDQMQIYMRWSGMDRALYLAVNKDTDELHGERVRVDKAAGERLEAKAERIIFAPEPLPRLSEDPAFFKCKWCPVAKHCHGDQLADVNCRTCAHATPERDGDGRWTCARHKKDLTTAEQEAACGDHLFIPALVRWGTVVDASETENWIEYETPDGFRFRNAGKDGRSADAYGSRELRAVTLPFLRDPQVIKIRAGYLPDAVFVDAAA